MESILKNIIGTLALLFLLVSLFVFSQSVQAESYDIYVDEGYEGKSNGSKDKPFVKIEDAINKAKSKDKIFISNGQYEEKITISEKVGIYGEDIERVIMKGTITVEDEATLENITVSGGNKAIIAEANAKVAISNSIIRDAARIGIDVSPGNGKISIKNSKIYNNGKGLFVQAGNRLEIAGSDVYKNREEGIDIREKVAGFIQGNEIYENGESGIEIILGDADMLISGNFIRDNAASGIATQYYEAFNNDGVLIVKNNNIKKNVGFGLRCDMPQAGVPSLDYWDRSMTLQDNIFKGNVSGNFSERCRLTLNKKEISDASDDEGVDQSLPKKTLAEEQRELEETQRILMEKINLTQERELVLENEFNFLETMITDKLIELRNRSGFTYFIKGPNKKIISEIGGYLGNSREKIGEMRAVAEQAPTEEIKGGIESEIISLEKSVDNSEQALNEIERDLIFWNRLRGLFFK